MSDVFKKIAARGQAALDKKEQEQAQMSLFISDLWADDQRGIPNELVRCALFNVRNKNIPRADLKNVELASYGDCRITYFGEELRQEDETIWMQMLHMAREQQLGEVVYFSPYSMCKALNWTAHQANYTRIVSSLTRMKGNAVKVFSTTLMKQGLGDGLGRAISLVKEFAWQGPDGGKLTQYEVTLDFRLAKLFGNVNYTRIEWNQRLKLPTGLPTWLHSFYASHKNPIPIKVEDLRKACGTDAAPRKFKQTLKGALDSLIEAKFLASAEVDEEGYVKVQRISRAQLMQKTLAAKDKPRDGDSQD